MLGVVKGHPQRKHLLYAALEKSHIGPEVLGGRRSGKTGKIKSKKKEKHNTNRPGWEERMRTSWEHN